MNQPEMTKNDAEIISEALTAMGVMDDWDEIVIDRRADGVIKDDILAYGRSMDSLVKKLNLILGESYRTSFEVEASQVLNSVT